MPYPFGEPTAELENCLSALLDRYPPLEEIREDEYSIWSQTPDCVSGYIGLGMALNTSLKDLEWILSTAHSHGLSVFDPQNDQLHTPDGRVLSDDKPMTPLHKIFRLFGLRKDT